MNTNIHAKKYISAVFEQRLRAEGFLCPDNKLLCWYRIRNQEILDTVIFCSNHNALPLFMEIRYEVTPLFIDPIYIKNVNWNMGTHDRTDIIRSTGIFEAEEGFQRDTYARFSDEIWVFAPQRGAHGLRTLEKVILPYFSEIQTVFDCYATCRRVHLDDAAARGYRPFRWASCEFIDMALYSDDRAVYPQCINRVNDALKMYKDLVYMKPNDSVLQKKLKHWEQLGAALSSESPEDYLSVLAERERRNLLYLEKLLKAKL